MLRWTDESVAIKCIDKALYAQQQWTSHEDPVREMRALVYLSGQLDGRHHVVPVLDCLEGRDAFYMVMPCLEEELFDAIAAREDRRYAEPEAIAVFADIIGGLEAVHALGLAHRDMSFENLMVDASGRVSIIDWGRVVRVARGPAGQTVKIAASPANKAKVLYTSPEVLRKDPLVDPLMLDVWSCGVMLFTLLAGFPPWNYKVGLTLGDWVCEHLTGGNVQAVNAHWGLGLSSDAVNLLQAMLNHDPDLRPTVAQIQASPWFQLRGSPPAGLIGRRQTPGD